MDAMRNSPSQVLVTSHSSEMLKNLSLDEIIFIYRNHDGNTKAKNAAQIPNIKRTMKKLNYDMEDMIKCGFMDDLEYGL